MAYAVRKTVQKPGTRICSESLQFQPRKVETVASAQHNGVKVASLDDTTTFRVELADPLVHRYRPADQDLDPFVLDGLAHALVLCDKRGLIVQKESRRRAFYAHAIQGAVQDGEPPENSAPQAI